MDKALKPAAAQTAIRAILAAGTVSYTRHATDLRMVERKLTIVDVTNVLRGGRVTTVEIVFGRFRYHVSTDTMCVVVEIQSESELVVVTAWRL